MAKPWVLNIEDKCEVSKIGKALSSTARLEILQLLQEESLSIVEISEKMNIAASSVALHIKVLDEAGLINTEVQPGTRGSVKLCSRKKDSILLELVGNVEYESKSLTINMPVGAYTACKVKPTCGIVTEEAVIGHEDLEYSFYLPERFKAQLLWTAAGYVEYLFPNSLHKKERMRNISFSMEICSEAPNYREDWKSEITLWVNGVECGTFLALGDYGERMGKITPSWWGKGSTQYGKLVTWLISHEGTYINEEKVSQVTLNQLGIQANSEIMVRIGNKENSQYVGGFNLFGEKFGDYNQNIVMNIEY